jgi:hypothetical protein
MIGPPASLSSQRVSVFKVAALNIESWPIGLAIAAVCAVVGLYVFKHLGYLP